MKPTRNRGIVASGALVALVVLAAIAVANLRPVEAADPSPSAPPVATPSPSAPPVATPSPPPTAPAGGVFQVDLDVAPPDDVQVVVTDTSGLVTGAASGRAGDGMSVRWNSVQVENVDANTLRVTWVGLPGDDEVRLTASGSAGDLRLQIVQHSPPPNSDATGHDRVLLLDFSGDVRAGDVKATIRSGSDS